MISALVNGFSVLISLQEVLRFFVILILIFFGYFFGYQRKDYALIKWVLLILILVNAFALLSLIGIGHSEIIDGAIRPVGVAGSSEVMSHLSLFSVLFSIFLLFSLKLSQNLKSVVIILLFMSLMTLSLSGTLKNTLMLFPSLVILAYFMGLRTHKIIFAFLILALFLSPIMVLNSLHVFDRLDSIISAGVNINIQEGDIVENSLAFRILHWKMLISDFYQNYLYLGVGAGNSKFMNGFGSHEGFTLEPHNDVLKYLLEFGIFGFFAFSILFIKVIRELLKNVKFEEFARFSLSCILSFMVVAFFGKVFFSAFNMYILSVLVGFSCGKAKKMEIENRCVV